jgi:ribosomal protein S18 acetylase RimI-like enzyme
MGNLRVITNQDADFYQMLGPFLSRRGIVKEIGGPVWDDDDRMWSIYERDGHIIGFCGFKPGHIGPVYVLPDERGEGFGKAVMLHALTQISGKVKVIAINTSVGFYEKLGFATISKSKNFTRMERNNG